MGVYICQNQSTIHLKYGQVITCKLYLHKLIFLNKTCHMYIFINSKSLHLSLVALCASSLSNFFVAISFPICKWYREFQLEFKGIILNKKKKSQPSTPYLIPNTANSVYSYS